MGFWAGIKMNDTPDSLVCGISGRNVIHYESMQDVQPFISLDPGRMIFSFKDTLATCL